MVYHISPYKCPVAMHFYTNVGGCLVTVKKSIEVSGGSQGDK